MAARLKALMLRRTSAKGRPKALSSDQPVMVSAVRLRKVTCPEISLLITASPISAPLSARDLPLCLPTPRKRHQGFGLAKNDLISLSSVKSSESVREMPSTRGNDSGSWNGCANRSRGSMAPARLLRRPTRDPDRPSIGRPNGAVNRCRWLRGGSRGWWRGRPRWCSRVGSR